ncbi:MAG: cupredoxin domain-containing protein [Chloroflexi bacterium]|nr:cupredoxin domain-containing protein [Chloroflexota bacterium]
MASSLARRREQQQRAARSRQIQQIARLVAFGAIVLLVLLVAANFLAPVFAPKASGITQSGNVRTVNIQAAMDGFDLTEIRARVGETVRVNLRSLDNEHHTDGAGKHQFAIDELGVNIIADPLSVNSGTFVATKAGTYPFYCDICCGGKANPTMNGKLIVEGA